MHDLQFGNALYANGTQMALKLDMYTPVPTGMPTAGASGRPAIVVVHGGGFSDGGKNEEHIITMSNLFASYGFVVAAVDYRLDMATGDVSAQALIDGLHDVRAAVRWIVRNSTRIGVDPHRVAIFGESSGGIIAAAAAYIITDGNSGNAGFPSNITASIALSGFLPKAGVQPTFDPATSPGYVDFHGTADPSVPYIAAGLTHAELDANGVQNWLVTIPGAVHEPYNQLLSAEYRGLLFGFLKARLSLSDVAC